MLHYSTFAFIGYSSIHTKSLVIGLHQSLPSGSRSFYTGAVEGLLTGIITTWFGGTMAQESVQSGEDSGEGHQEYSPVHHRNSYLVMREQGQEDCQRLSPPWTHSLIREVLPDPEVPIRRQSGGDSILRQYIY